jgi:hypothetical protein
MRRGVAGDPAEWIASTGIEPATLEASLAAAPATIQERWFGKLYLMKALVIGTLAAFWIASGLIATTIGFDAAAGHLTSRGVARPFANVLAASTSLLDIVIGALIAWRDTCKIGLLAGVTVSVAYLAGASLMAPELWADPLGPLVKVLPAFVLMLVGWAIFEDR